MEQSTQELKKYIDNLAPAVKTAVLGNEWHRRVQEIGVKYNLTAEQTGNLEYEVLFVMIGMEPEGDFAGNIEKEVGVSKILAGQIAEDVDGRVFQYILKLTEGGNTKNETRKTENTKIPAPNTTMPNYTTPVSTPSPGLLSEMETMVEKVPTEHHQPKMTEPPANLPGVEEGEKLMRDSGYESTTARSPVPAPGMGSRKPSIADTKLNVPITSTRETVVKETPAQTNNPISKGYVADPYREPLE